VVNLADLRRLADESGVDPAHSNSFVLLAGAAAAMPLAETAPEDLFVGGVDALGYSTLPLRLWSDPRGADLRAVVEAVRQLDVTSFWMRLAFVGDVDDDVIELARSASPYGLRSVSRARLDGPPVRPLDWPIRIVIDEMAARPLHSHRWARNLIEVVDPRRPGARPHIVVGSPSFVEQWATRATERASLVVIVGRVPEEEPLPVLGHAAGGWVRFPLADEGLVETVASSLIVELSHNRAVDEAVALTGQNSSIGPGNLVASPAWLAMSSLTRTLARAADVQERIEKIDGSRSNRGPRPGLDPALPDTADEPSLKERFRGRRFDSEVTDASEAAPELQAVRRGAADRDDRYLTADVGPAPDDVTILLDVWIAPVEAAGSAVAPDRFVDEALPWNGVSIPLELALFELRDGGLAERKSIELPPAGPSSRAQFSIPRGSRFDARVVVLHEYRFVQSMLLTVDALGTRVSLDRECLIRPAGADLLDATPHGAALVLNDHDGPLLAVSTPAGDEIHAPQGLDEARRSMTSLLGGVIDDPDAFGSLSDPKYATLLVELAKRGSTLRDTLFTGAATAVAPQIYQALRDATRISVFSAVPSHILPLEFVYEPPLRIPLGQAGSICEHARTALSEPAPDMAALQAACRHVGDGGTCAATESQVCPLGFWGLRKVIERHTNRTRRGAIERDYAVSSSPHADRPTVNITRVMAAATPRADANPASAWQAARDAMAQALGSNLTVAPDWPSIVDEFTTEHSQLGMMVLLPHVDKDQSGQLRLDLGSEPHLPVHEVAQQLELRKDSPVVLLLGCVTGPSESPTEEFPGRFLDAGASAVLATMTMVRGRFVADIARAIVVAVRQDVADHGFARLGDAILHVRQTLLGTNPLVLTLVAYGDADWTLVGAAPGEE
jgi:hypothetical protein